MQELITAICAAGGAHALAILGFLSSKEPFDMRKFAASILTAIIAGVGVAVTVNYTATDISVISCLLAFLTGAGADASRKAVAKNVSRG